MPRTSAPWEVEREMLTKADGITDPRYGCQPDHRSAEQMIKLGVINLDKPSGPSSHEIAAWVKRLLKIDRAGHGGTLEA